MGMTPASPGPGTPSTALIKPPPSVSDYPALFFQSCMKNQVGAAVAAPFLAIAQTFHLLVHWVGVGEAERFDARIRMKRWLNRIDELAEGKRKIKKAFSFSKKKWQTMYLAKWAVWAEKEARIRGAATKLKLKRAFIHKWRVEFMGLCAEIKEIKDRIREVIDPEAAGKMRGLEAFEEQIRIKKMFIRARQHHVGTYFKRKWLGAIERKKALQAKIDGVQQRSEAYKAKVRFWKAMERVMEEWRTRQRAASAFTMRAPRLAWNQWELMLTLRQEARREAIWLCSTEGKHYDFVKKMLAKLSAEFREEVFLIKVDEGGLNPLMWAAKRGQTAAAELILSYGGRLGNNANTRDLLLAEDNEGVTALHHAARGGHNGVMNALLVLASTLDVDIVNAMNLDGSTALHWAARKNNELGIRMLLHHGADRHARNKWGATPLDNAVYAPNGAYHAVAMLSQDADQIKQALKEDEVQSKIRPSEEEKREEEAYTLQVAEEKRVESRTRLKRLNTARLEGWLGWHAERQAPDLVMPERHMRNADAALERAIHPEGSANRPPPPAYDGGLGGTPSPQQSSRTAPPHTPDEHAELVRALDEAVKAGNHKSGVMTYEDRVQDATKVLRLLKYDMRVPSRTPPPPSPVRTDEEQAVLNDEEARKIATAVDTARARAASPPQAVDGLGPYRAEMYAQLERRVANTSPRKARGADAEASSPEPRSAPTALRTKPALPRKGAASVGGAARPLTDGSKPVRSPQSSERGKSKGARVPKWDGKPRTAATPGGSLGSPPGGSQQGSHRSPSVGSSKARKGRSSVAPKSPGPKRLEFEDGGGS